MVLLVDKSDKEFQGRGFWEDYKDNYAPCEYGPREKPLEWKLLVWHNLWMCYQLSPATPMFAQWSYEQSGLIRRDRSDAWNQKHWFPLIKFDLANVTSECLICQLQRLRLSPWYGDISQRDFLDTWWYVDCIRHLPWWRWLKICSYWNRHRHWCMDLSFLFIMLLPVSPSWTHRMLNLIKLFPIAIILMKELFL